MKPGCIPWRMEEVSTGYLIECIYSSRPIKDLLVFNILAVEYVNSRSAPALLMSLGGPSNYRPKPKHHGFIIPGNKPLRYQNSIKSSIKPTLIQSTSSADLQGPLQSDQRGVQIKTMSSVSADLSFPRKTKSYRGCKACK